jgi:hypothetical protein
MNLVDIRSLILIIFILFILPVPLTSAFAWLIAKGSNWKNNQAAVAASWFLPINIFPLLLGGFLGFNFFQTWGGIILGAIFYIVAHLIYLLYSKRLTNKLIRFMLR